MIDTQQLLSTHSGRTESHGGWLCTLHGENGLTHPAAPQAQVVFPVVRNSWSACTRLGFLLILPAPPPAALSQLVGLPLVLVLCT